MSPELRRFADSTQGWLVALPALILAWAGEGALIADVPTATSAGAGWLVILSLPAAFGAILLALVGAGPYGRAAGLRLLLFVVLLAIVSSEGAGDGFEARRALCVLSSAVVLLLSAASLGPGGRRSLARGLAIAALASVLGSWLDDRDGLGGSVGNTGHLADLALPGAALGLGLLVDRSRFMRPLGLLAALAVAIHSGLAPSLTALTALGLTLIAAFARGARGGPIRRWARAGLVTLAVGALMLGFRSAGNSAQPVDSARPPTASAGDLGGVGFRLRTWARVPGMVMDHPLGGVGPGQFEREFPPYRDPVELIASSHGRGEPTPIEVEHPHNDWLLGLAEYGLLGGGMWLGFLLLALVHSLRHLGDRSPIRASFGAAGLTILITALASSPLLSGPAAPAAAWPVLGVVLASPRRRPADRRLLKRSTTVGIALLAFWILGIRQDQAWSFIEHGRALEALTGARVIEHDGVRSLDPRDVEDAAERALAAAPDSVIALEQRARLPVILAEDGADRREADLRRLVEIRPHRLAALQNLGSFLAATGRFEEAEEYFAHALALDAQNPQLLRSHVRLAGERGDGKALVERLRRAREADALDESWVERTAADLLLGGRPGMAQPLVDVLESGRNVGDANACYAWSLELKEDEARTRLADSAAAAAQLYFGRGHAVSGAPSDAVRSYRQALRLAERYSLPDGAVMVRLELAAALVLDGQREAAVVVLEGTTPAPRHWSVLPEWAGQALLEAGLLGQAGS